MLTTPKSAQGLFQENGPCHFVNGASTPSLNPYSFNTYANMLYVDQPIGTGKLSFLSNALLARITFGFAKFV